jgi:hypothetical protein
VERAALLPLPPTPWAPVTWKQAKLHPDCHVVFNGAYYSAPFRWVGQRLWVRGTATLVQLFHAHVLVASHLSARPGQRRTCVEHLPPGQGPLPAPDPGVVPAAGGRDRAHLRRLHRGAPGRSPPRSAPERPGCPPARPPLRGAAPRSRLRPGHRSRRVPLPDGEDHPGEWPRSPTAPRSRAGAGPREARPPACAPLDRLLPRPH